MRGAALLAVLALALAACAAPPPLAEVPAPDLGPVWDAVWRSDLGAAVARADERGWQAGGSVAGERVRQSLRSRRGELPALVEELRRWREAAPDQPDLAYLEARLIQRPERALRRFRELNELHPRHPWIGLGLASLELGEGAPEVQVRRLLARTPARADTLSFRRQVEARLLARADRLEAALELLEASAFDEGDRDALLTWVELASQGGDQTASERGQTEIVLRRLDPAAPLERRIAQVAARAVAEAAARPELGLDAFLALLDRWCERAALVTGWASAPRYTLGPFGALVRPERDAGGPAAQWAEAGWTLLAGAAAFHGLEVAVLSGARRVAVPWPGQELPLEIVIARAGRSSRPNVATGGTVFRGFYIREDLLQAGGRGAAERLAEVVAPALAPGDDDWPRADGILPEDWDLPLRLRARLARSEEAVAALELEALLLHEAGHLPEVLAWLPARASLLGALPALLGSLLRSGDPLAWMEYRAEARALAAAADPRWLLAEVVATSRAGSPRYRAAYARLLRELLALARARGWPPLARWDEFAAAEIHELAVELCRAEGLEELPTAAVRELLVRAAAAVNGG